MDGVSGSLQRPYGVDNVQAEAEFRPPAGAEAPAHKLPGSCSCFTPVTSEDPCYPRALGNFRRFEE